MQFAYGKKMILGMGVTGIAVADFLQQKKISFDLMDSNYEKFTKFNKDYPTAKCFLQTSLNDDANLTDSDLNSYTQIIASPGVDLNKNRLALRARKLGIAIIGDIEIFAQYAQAPIIAITGSNGKSTVTTLLAEVLQKAGFKVGVGGNLGKPSLDLLNEKPDFFVVELSSFQLETCFSLKPFIGIILNITPDHLDRHITMQNYIEAKHKIYKNAQNIIYYREDKNTYPKFLQNYTNRQKRQNLDENQSLSASHFFSFGLDAPKNAEELGVLSTNKGLILALGQELIITTFKLGLAGKIGILNSQVALIVTKILSLDFKKTLEVLETFQGLAHRCKKIAEVGGLVFYDDSKATNINATLAGVENLTLAHKNIYLILGGDGKGQDFVPLQSMQNIAFIAIFGKDKHKIHAQLKHNFACVLLEDLCESVSFLASKAKFGDAILLSPACASLDMFKNYEHRGKEFLKCVMQLN